MEVRVLPSEHSTFNCRVALKVMRSPVKRLTKRVRSLSLQPIYPLIKVCRINTCINMINGGIMNYTKLYNNIIENRRKNLVDGYTENHHIIPRCLGGDDSADNLIKLTAREHFLCHYLLTKMYKPNTRNWYKMINAFIMMNAMGERDRYINSRLYESRRIHFSNTMRESQSGSGNSQHGTKWIYNMVLEQCKKIPKEDEIPEGWESGRVQDFKKKKVKIEENIKSQQKLLKEKTEFERIKKERHIELFTFFKEGKYDSLTEFLNDVNYEYSKQILVANWRKYLNLPKLKWGTRFTSNFARELDLL